MLKLHWLVGGAILALATTITLAGLLHPETRPIYVMNDPGGNVQEYDRWVDRLTLSKTPVEVTGECDSACTLILALPERQICAWPGAAFGFHLAINVEHPQGDVEFTDWLIKRYYPEPVQRWLAEQTLTLDIIYLFGRDMFRLHAMRECAL